MKLGAVGIWGCSLVFVPEVTGQWLELDVFMRDQVAAGWWLPQERQQVLGHLEQTGLPVAPEEAFAVAGLSYEAARALMEAPSWLQLVRRANENEGNGDGLGAEIRASTGEVPASIRLRNTGKWALRWDGDQAQPVGYLMMHGRRRRWSGIIGGHRLGWGHRLLMDEGALFGGLDAPSFALPVHYDVVPAWGTVESIPRSGLALRSTGSKQAVLSVHDAGKDVAVAVRSRSGMTGYAGRWRANAGFSAVVWKEGYSGIRHWLAEAGRLEEGWGMRGTCQWTPNRNEEERLRIELLMPRDGTPWEVRGTAGGEWLHSGRKLRMRWMMQWSNSDAWFPLWFKWRYAPVRDQAWELHWRAAPAADGGEGRLRRLEVRWVWKAEPYTSRVMWVPFLDAGLTGALSWFVSANIGPWRCRHSFSVWNMPTGRRAYGSEPTLGGTSYRIMSGSGHRWTASLERKARSGWALKALAVLGATPEPPPEGSNMLTPTYAQSQFQLAVRLNM